MMISYKDNSKILTPLEHNLFYFLFYFLSHRVFIILS